MVADQRRPINRTYRIRELRRQAAFPGMHLWSIGSLLASLAQTYARRSKAIPSHLVPTDRADMHLEKITDSAFQAITIKRLGSNSNIPSGQDEDFLAQALVSAEDYVERYLECTIGLAEWRLTLDSFPRIDGRVIPLLIPLWPIRSVTELQYVAADGTPTVLPLDQIVQPIGNDRYHLQLKKGCSWPATDCSPNAIAIRFNAGWPTQSKVPGTLTQAIRMLVSHWYENREAVLTATISKEIELGVNAMLDMLETEYD